MAPPAAGSNASANAPMQSGALAKAIDAAFGSFAAFKTNFSEGAAKCFGSGFEWLIVQPDNGNKLATTSTPNQVGGAGGLCRLEGCCQACFNPNKCRGAAPAGGCRYQAT